MGRGGGLIGVLLLIWLLIGVFASYQRHYFESGNKNCAETSTVIVTILAGPLNYVGVNPKVGCPHPSK